MKLIKMNSLFIFATGSILLSASMAGCKSGKEQGEKNVSDTMAMEQDSNHMINHLIVDNQKDPSCGMPTSAGISDTVHYKDHVLGFCSKECREDFMKNPEAQLAAAALKK